jgi:hypothetical protein
LKILGFFFRNMWKFKKKLFKLAKMDLAGLDFKPAKSFSRFLPANLADYQALFFGLKKGDLVPG